MDPAERWKNGKGYSKNTYVRAAIEKYGWENVKHEILFTDLPEEEAFLWLMKDGDAMIAIGCERGQVTATENVSFAPGGAINWTPTITGLDDGFQLIMDEGA